MSGGKARGDEGDDGSGYGEHLEHHNHEETPYQERNHIVHQVEVDVRFLERDALPQFPDDRTGFPHAVESLDGIVQVAEEEIQAEDEDQLEQRQLESLELDERLDEEVAGRAGEVEHLAGHGDGDGQRPGGGRRYHAHPEEVVEPGNLDIRVLGGGQRQLGIVLPVLGLAFAQVPFVAAPQQDGQGQHRLDERQLEHPPDGHHEGQHGEPVPRHAGADRHDGKGQPEQHRIHLGHLAVVAQVHGQLPDGGAQQEQGEEEIDDAVRDEDNAEIDDHERHDQGGQVALERAAGLLPVQADEHGQEDGGEEPGVFRQAPGGIGGELVSPRQVEKQENGENQHTGQEREDHFVVLEIGCPEKLHPLEPHMHQQESQQRGRDEGQHHIKGMEQHLGAPPGTVGGAGGSLGGGTCPIFVLEVLLDAVPIAGRVQQHPEETVAAAGGEALLHLTVSFLGIVVGLLEHGVRFLVVFVVFLQRKDL